MIVAIYILDKEGNVKLEKTYAIDKQAPKLPALRNFISALSTLILKLESEEIDTTTIGDLKFSYTNVNDQTIVICADKFENKYDMERKIKEIKEKLIEAKKQLLGKGVSEEQFFKHFANIIDDIIVTPVKISLVGYGGVGKTTILKLIRGETPPKEYKPTLTPEVATLESAMEGTVETASVGNVRVVVWDFAGQEQFRALWNLWMRGSDIVILVTDSTYENVMKTKFLLDLIREWAPHIKVIAFANKQDLPEAMKPEEVSEILGIKTHGTIAIDPTYRPIILDILKKTIESVLREGIKCA